MKKFLIINPFGIGDVLFTAPVIRAIKEDNPDNLVGYWCNERVRDVLGNNPRIDKIFALSRGDIKKIYQRSRLEGIRKFLNLLRQIKKEKFEVALDFSLDHRYGLISKILGIKKRIGFNYKGRGMMLTDKVDIEGYSKKHVIEYYLDLLKTTDIMPKSGDLELFVSPDAKIKARQILLESGISDSDLIIGIAPAAGASWGKDAWLKHWPADNFAQLADRLIAECRAKILLLGDGSERQVADKIYQAAKQKPLDLIGKTSLEDLIGLMSYLNALIANDGGPLHMAVALNVKTVSIFGPVDEVVYGPYPPSPRHIVIKGIVDCRPCYQNFRMPDCPRDRECINSISVDEVFAAVRRLL